MSAISGPDFYDECERDRVNMLRACMRGQLNEVKAYIVEGKVGADEADGDGVTALQISAAKGYRHLVDYLIRQADASVDLANNASMTPLLHACREGHVDVVTVLISYRANVNLLTGLGVSALTLACAGKHMGVVKVLKTMQRQLTSIPITPHATPSVAPTPFMCASYNRDIDMCGYLAHNFPTTNCEVMTLGLDAETFTHRCGLDYILSSVEERVGRKDTMAAETRDLGVTIVNGRLDEIAPLIPSTTWHLGELSQQDVTPLMLAVAAGRLDVVRFIVQSAVNVQLNAQERLLGMTALVVAVAVGSDDMVQLLLAAGADATIPLIVDGAPCALDIAQSSVLRSDTLLLLYKSYLGVGGNDDDGSKAYRGGALIESSHVSRRPSGHSILSTTGKRVGKVVFKSFLQRVGLPEIELPNALNVGFHDEPNNRCNEWSLAVSAATDWGTPPLEFGLADDVLSGDSCLLPSTSGKSSPSTLIKRARDLVMRWLRYGDKLQSSPLEEDGGAGIKASKHNTMGVVWTRSKSGSPSNHCAGKTMMYSLAQRNVYERVFISQGSKPSVSRSSVFAYSPSATPYQRALQTIHNERGILAASTLPSSYSFASTAPLAASSLSVPPILEDGLAHELGPSPTSPLTPHKASLPDTSPAGSTLVHLTLSGGRMPTQKLKATGVRNAPSRPNSELHHHRRLLSTTRSTGSGDGHRLSIPNTLSAAQAQPKTPTMRPANFPNSTPASIAGSQLWSNGHHNSNIQQPDAGFAGSPSQTYGRHFVKRAITHSQQQPRRMVRVCSGSGVGSGSGVYQELSASGLQRFVDCFLAEEVDEETLHSLSVDEVKEILGRHGVDVDDASSSPDIGKLIELFGKSKKD